MNNMCCFGEMPGSVISWTLVDECPHPSTQARVLVQGLAVTMGTMGLWNDAGTFTQDNVVIK